MAHAELPPSGAAAWVHCSLWPEMNALYPSADTDSSEEGTAAHWLLTVGRTRESLTPYLNAEAPNGVLITQEMIDGAVMFWNAAHRYGTPDGNYVVEQRLPPSDYFGLFVWGTPDLFFWTDGKNLYVFDYKFGHGFVDVVRCWQLIVYVCLLMDWYDVTGSRIDDQQLTVHLTIVQPRNFHRDGHVRMWSVKACDLRAERNLIAGAAGDYEAGKRVAKTGDHCQYCPGASRCPTLQQVSYRAIDVSEQATPFQLPPKAAGFELRTLKAARDRLSARISGLEDEILAQCDRGNHEAGYVVERGTGREYWSVPHVQIQNLEKLFGIKLFNEPKPLTPKQARDAGIAAPFIQPMTKRGEGEPVLVPFDQSRAAKIFGGKSGA